MANSLQNFKNCLCRLIVYFVRTEWSGWEQDGAGIQWVWPILLALRRLRQAVGGKGEVQAATVTHIKTASVRCSLCPYINVFKNQPSLDAHMLARHKGQRDIDRC